MGKSLEILMQLVLGYKLIKIGVDPEKKLFTSEYLDTYCTSLTEIMLQLTLNDAAVQ